MVEPSSVVLLSLVGTWAALDGTAVGQFLFARPLVAATMGGWVLDYIENWAGEWGYVRHTWVQYRNPAFTGDVTYTPYDPYGFGTSQSLSNRPLLVGFRPFAGGGFVLYTTFHYHAQPSAQMLDILKYLIFQL